MVGNSQLSLILVCVSLYVWQFWMKYTISSESCKVLVEDVFFSRELFFFFPIVLIIFILVLTMRKTFNLLTWSLLDEVESINLNSKLYGRQYCYYEFSESPPFLRLSWVCQVSHLFPIVASNVPFHWRYSPSRVLTLMESTCLLCEAQNFVSCPQDGC